MPSSLPPTSGENKQNSLHSILRSPTVPLTGSPRSPAAAIKSTSLPAVTVNGHKAFWHRNGAKLHAFPRNEVPWPFQFNRETLEQSVMDQLLVRRVRDSQTFTDFGDKPPRRCLDLGTALGGWIIETARQFPECTFVGFDVVDIQISLDYVDPSIASRIEWIHGNFLKFPLPFNDNEFDYIHACGIALGVPEDKWDMLFEELNRILSPGGHIELIQQDAQFPILPWWFTEPLHAHLKQRTVDLPDGEHPTFNRSSEVFPKLPHAYALLEGLYISVFESRWINRTPSSILPGYFSSTFRQVISPPILRFPMPPIAPLIPQSVSISETPSPLISPSTFLPASETTSDPFDPWAYFIPNTDSGATSLMTASTTTIADTDSVRSDTTLRISILQELDVQFPEQQYDLDRELKPYSRGRSLPLGRAQSRPGRKPSAPSPLSYCESIPSPHPTSPNASSCLRAVAILCPTETTQLGAGAALDLFRVERLLAMGDDSLFMHLYQAAHYVYALTEAMWDELRARVELNDPKLSAYGWSTDDYSLEASRIKFDGLIAQYKRDMQYRLSLWHSCTKHGWILPKRQPLTQAELVQEDELRQAILEARKYATEKEFSNPVRSIRLLIGVKQT